MITIEEVEVPATETEGAEVGVDETTKGAGVGPGEGMKTSETEAVKKFAKNKVCIHLPGVGIIESTTIGISVIVENPVVVGIVAGGGCRRSYASQATEV